MKIPKKLIYLSVLKFMALVCLVTHVWMNRAYGQAKFLEVTLSGNHNKSENDLYVNTRTSLGLEIGIPMSNVFEIGVGHTLTTDKYEHSAKWRISENEKIRLTTGISNALPAQDYVTLYRITDTSVNASLGYTFAWWRPYVFGGGLWRSMCYQSPYGMDQEECFETATWNAGFGIGAMLSASWRLKITHRVSPSFRTDEKTLDQMTQVGITWSL